MMRAPTVRGFQRTPSAGIFRRAAGFSPLRLPNLAAWYDLGPTRQVGTASNDIRIDSSNRVSLLSDESGNSAVNCFVSNVAASQTMTSPNKSVTGTTLFTLDLGLDDYTPAADQTLVDKLSGNNGFQIVLLTTGVFRLRVGNGASVTNLDSTTANTLADRARGTIGIAYVQGTGVSFTQNGAALGTNVSSAVVLTNAAVAITVGSTTGRIYRVQVGSVYDCDPSQSASKLLTNGATFTSGGDTWTLNSSGDLGARICGERDLVQLTASKQPIYLPWSGTNYGWLRGNAADFFSTPDSASVSVTGDIDLRAEAALNSWAAPSTAQYLLAKMTGAATDRSYSLHVRTDGFLVLTWSPDGTSGATIAVASTSALTFAAFQRAWVRATLDVDNGASGYTATFFTSTDGTTWSQLGLPVVGGATTSIFNGTLALNIGIRTGGAESVTGSIFRAQVLNGIGGTVVADFDPSRYTSGTTFTASTGETWTLNGGATIVTATSLYFDGTDDYMKAAAFSLSQPETVYFVGQQVSWTNTDALVDGNANNGLQITQFGSTPALIAFTSGSATTLSNAGLPIGATGVVSGIFNGASSALRVNRGTAATGTLLNVAANGFTVAANGSGLGAFANQRTNEIAVYAAAHDTATQDRFALYAASKWRISGV